MGNFLSYQHSSSAHDGNSSSHELHCMMGRRVKGGEVGDRDGEPRPNVLNSKNATRYPALLREMARQG